MVEISEKYLEQKIGWYKLILTLVFASAAGSLGWFVNHLDSLDTLKMLALLGFAIFASGVAFCISRVRHYIKLLGDMK